MKIPENLSNSKKPRRSQEGPPQKRKLPSLSQELKYRLSNPLDPPPGYDVSDTFNWGSALDEEDFIAPPVSAFPHAPMNKVFHHFQRGMRVEVPNLDYKRTSTAGGVYWHGSLQKICGYKALIRYEGMGNDGNFDFWLNLCTDSVRPIGYCTHKSLPIIPPKCVQEARPELKDTNEWRDFLANRLTGSRTLPLDFGDIVIASQKCTFRPGMHVEMTDRRKLSQVRPGIVVDVIAKRLRVVYGEDAAAVLAEAEAKRNIDSPDDEETVENEFWCHICSALVHPVGWALSTGHDIECSDSYRADCRRKIEANSYTDDDAKPDMFPQHPSETPILSFAPGQKLEALDPLDLSHIVPATVSKVLSNGYLMVSFDGTADSFCYHHTSSYIFPCGFCDQNGIELTSPKGASKSKFDWPSYLSQTKSVAAPVSYFNTEIIHHEFRKGHKLECTDLMDPQLVCVATVAEVNGRLLRIHFDGWEDDFDQFIDCESPDLCPVGWGEAVGYKIEPPKEPDDGPSTSARQAKKLPSTSSSSRKPSTSNRGPPPAKRKKVVSSATPSQVDELLSRANSAVSSGQNGSVEGLVGDSGSPLDLTEDDSIQYPASNTPTPTPSMSTPQLLAASPSPTPSGSGLAVVLTTTGGTSTSATTTTQRAASAANHSSSAVGGTQQQGQGKGVHRGPALHPHTAQRTGPSAVPPAPTSAPDDGGVLFPAELRGVQVGAWTVEQVVLFLKENDVESIIPTVNKQEINGKRLLDLKVDGLTGAPLHLKINTALKMKAILMALKAMNR